MQRVFRQGDLVVGETCRLQHRVVQPGRPGQGPDAQSVGARGGGIDAKAAQGG